MLNDKVKLVCKADNVLKLKNDLCLHEIKTSKYLTEDYVKNIKNDFQTHIYFHGYNLEHKPPIKKILYDVIKKPSIRKKKIETYSQFLKRLYEYYQNPNDSELFYMDEITRPLVSKDKLMNVLYHVADDILACKEEKDYYHNFKYCYVFHRCEFYELCMYGVNKLNMMNFKQKDVAYNELSNSLNGAK
jgi:CO dehydrogenase/acetyl-CoA synthase alpha subunit